ncbi:MAG: RluA family pseudouridine synthase [Defluviitaleaceae bacterium]|nr:RluA family pseudouridine synthase [Defluviitaleaceae bacterium]
MLTLKAAEQDFGTRLDIFAAAKLDLSRTNVQNHITNGNILVNKKKAAKRYTIKANDIITCIIPQPEVYNAAPEPIPLDIIYQDADIIIINKAQGMVVHPAPGNYSGTLVNALLHHCKDLSGVNGVMRPGIVHRLDKETSGLIAIAKHDKAHHGLAAQLANHSMGRIYWAVAQGVIQQDTFTINKNITRHPTNRKKMTVTTATMNKMDKTGKTGKTAITHITVLKRHKNATLLTAKLQTGRTHQIRVHLSHIGHPVLGDIIYGNANNPAVSSQLLHAKILELEHPITGEKMYFEVPLPDIFENWI